MNATTGMPEAQLTPISQHTAPTLTGAECGYPKSPYANGNDEYSSVYGDYDYYQGQQNMAGEGIGLPIPDDMHSKSAESIIPGTVQDDLNMNDDVETVTAGDHIITAPKQRAKRADAYILARYQPHIMPLVQDETYTFVCWPQPTLREYLESFPHAGEKGDMPAIGQEQEYLKSKGPEIVAKFENFVARQEENRLRKEGICQEACKKAAKRRRPAFRRAQRAAIQPAGLQDMAPPASEASRPSAAKRRRRKDERKL